MVVGSGLTVHPVEPPLPCLRVGKRLVEGGDRIWTRDSRYEFKGGGCTVEMDP